MAWHPLPTLPPAERVVAGLGFGGEWEFITPNRLQFAPDPEPGRVRTWHVDPIHVEGEWLPCITEIRHNPGGNGVVEREIGKQADGKTPTPMPPAKKG